MADSRICSGLVPNDGDERVKRYSTLILLLVLATVLMIAGPLASQALAQSASSDQNQAEKEEAAKLNCEDFATQRAAQALFEISHEDRFELDPDSDGVACETTWGGIAEDRTALGAETGGELDCMDFPSQKAAQDRLREDPSDPYKLDPERNGVACDIRPTEYADQVTDVAPVSRANSGTDLDCNDFEFQQEAQMVYLQDPSDPNGLDGPNEAAEKDKRFVGNGFACETMPLLASNVEQSKVLGKGAESAPQAAALVAAWPRGGGLGLLLDLAALLMVVSGTSTLLVAWRVRRSSDGNSR